MIFDDLRTRQEQGEVAAHLIKASLDDTPAEATGALDN
jgi:hypothetical protein